MSERRRRGGVSRRFLVWGGWGVLVLLLGGNIVLSLVSERGFLTPDLVQRVAFWLPVALSCAAAVVGMYWTNRALVHNERASLVWMRRGFVFALVGTVVLGWVVFEPATFPREWLAAVAAILFSLLTLHFAFSALHEYRRAELGPGHRRRSRSPDELPVTGHAPVPADATRPQ